MLSRLINTKSKGLDLHELLASLGILIVINSLGLFDNILRQI